jgi:hypothetical protein
MELERDRLERGKARYSLHNSAEWKEDEHPRAEDGKFGSGEGSAGESKDGNESETESEDTSDISESNISTDMAKDILTGDEPIPDGWYVHGRSTDKKIESTSYAIEMTQDIDIGNQYAGNQGNVYLMKPKPNAVVADFSSDSKDMDQFIENIGTVYEWYENDELDQETREMFDEIIGDIKSATGEEDVDFDMLSDQIRSAFAPESIVDSAGAYDNPTWMGLLTFYQAPQLDNWPDFINTPDGAVMPPGALPKIDTINLTEKSGGYRNR